MFPLNTPTATLMALIRKSYNCELLVATINSYSLGSVWTRMVKRFLSKLKVLSPKRRTLIRKVKRNMATTIAMKKARPKLDPLIRQLIAISIAISMLVLSKLHT